MRNRLIAEVFGSFWIVFAGTGAIIVNDMTGVIGHIGIAITFGLIVFAMISALGDVSGAHFNPAVTIAFYTAGRMPFRDVIPYILSQCSGAILASLSLSIVFPEHGQLGMTTPSGSLLQAWVLECLLSLGLMFVILQVSTGAKEKGITAGLAIGAMVALEALFAGPICGASMNPARSLGPALVSGNWQHLWVYLSAPVIGMLLAVGICLCTREQNCCSTSEIK